ncbi:TetR/AcrR family transcriptional regulator [bacterium]|nr:TetR/AcrR family transcriptional regulator [bacterium]
MRQREKDKIRNKGLFLAAARELFTEKGFQRTTMEEIARRAGFSKATIYNYFTGKEQLLAELIKGVFSSLHRNTDEIFSEKVGLTEGIDTYIDMSMSYLKENRNFFRVMMSEGFRLGSLIEDVIHPNVFAGMDGLKQKLTSFFEGHEKELAPSIPPSEMARMLVALIMGYAADWVMADEESDLMSKKGLILELFYRGALK